MRHWFEVQRIQQAGLVKNADMLSRIEAVPPLFVHVAKRQKLKYTSKYP